MLNPFLNTNIKVGVGRAGNVIGGGDWAENRIIQMLLNLLKKIIH